MTEVLFNRPKYVKAEEYGHIPQEREKIITLLDHFNFDRVSKCFKTRCEREFGWLQVASVVVSIFPSYGLMATWQL